MTTAEPLEDLYELGEVVFAGGMAAIHRAREKATGKLVAIKRLNGEERVERLQREGDILAAVNAAGVVRLVGRGTGRDGRPYLALEWLEGETLLQVLRRGPLSVESTLVLACRLAGALAALHRQGIVHRDLKPGNVIIVGGKLEQATLIDFGIGRVVVGSDPDEMLTVEGTVIGTPGYLSPEQARGLREVDARADLFALGCVLFRCAAGRAVFSGATPTAVLAKILLEEATHLRDVCPAAPHALDSLIARLLAKDPAARPSDGAAVFAEVSAILTSYGSEPTPPPAAILTADERRLLSVVALAGSAPPRVRQVAAELDGRLEELADGVSVIAFVGAASATKLAERAGRLAVAALHESPTAVATGIGAVGMPRSRPAGEVIERVVAALADAAPGAARIDDVTASLLGPRFAVERSERGYLLTGELDPELRAPTARRTPLCGRDVEIVSLEALFDECADEPVARAALITGPSGMGKSRLADELLGRLRTRDPALRIWRGRGDAGARAAPYGILAGCVRDACGIRSGEPAAVQREKLRERILAQLGSGEEVHTFLAEAVGIGAAEAGASLRAARRDPALMADQTARAAIAWVRAECNRGPVVLVLDDLQWGDRSSLAITLALLRQLPSAPLFLLGLARPDVDGSLVAAWEEPGTRRIVLGGLLSRSARALVTGVIGEGPSAEVVNRIVAQAEGNPLHLEELARAHAAGRAAVDTVAPLALAQARLEQLPAAARRVLRGASVFGEAFWRSALVLLTGLDPVELEVEMDRLERAAVVTRREVSRFPGEMEHAFAHDVWREAAYASLTDADRALGHGLAAEWLMRQPGEHDPLVLAEHHDRAGRAAEAAGWYCRAAEHALGANDLAGAVERAERAAACGAEGATLGTVRLVRAEAREWLGDYDGAIEDGRQAMSLLPVATTPWFRAATAVATALGQRADTAGLLELWRELPTAPGRDEAAISELVCLARTAVPLFQVAEMVSGCAALDRAIALASELGSRLDPAAQGWLNQARSWLTFFQGDMAESYRYDALSAERFQAAGDARNACRQLGNAGFYKMVVGSFDEADALLEEATRDAERFGLLRVLAMTLQNLGLIQFMRGNLPRARVLLGRAIEIAGAQASARMEGIARVYHSRALRAAGALREAEAEARRGAEILVAAPPLRPYSLAALADVLLATDRAAEASEHAAEAFRLMQELPCVDEGDVFVRLVHARALRAVGQTEHAAEAAAAAREHLMSRVSALKDPAERETFLSRIPENAETLALS